ADRLTVTVGDAGLNDFLLSLTDNQTDNTTFTGANTLTARDLYHNVVVGFDAATDNVTFTDDQGGTFAGLGSGGTNVLDRATDFVNGVANLSGGAVPNAIAWNGGLAAPTAVLFTATSASAKTGSTTITISP